VGGLRAPGLDLALTLESGQFFRWFRDGSGFVVQTRGRAFRAEQRGSTLDLRGAGPGLAREFFGLREDVVALRRALAPDRALRDPLRATPGLRMIRQEPWECLCAFLTSIASNIPRISRNVEDMARRFGRPLRFGGRALHAFPRPEELGGERELRALGLGFRARWLAEAARRAADGRLERIRLLGDAEAREALMEFPGVAEKVADCVLLFAYGRGGAFPVDTWIRKAMRRLCFGGRRVSDRAIRDLARERWGERAGYAQQALYLWARGPGRSRFKA
jgi:N-glycosylase/DNA lyase